MATVINFADAAAARGKFCGIGTTHDVSSCDTLDCPYCGRPTKAAQVTADWTTVYRCSCKKVFRISEDGSLYRGLRGRAF